MEDDKGPIDQLPSPPMKNQRKNGSSTNPSKQGETSKGTKDSSQRVDTIFKEPIYRFLNQIKDKDYFKWPSKMIGDPSKRD